MTAELGTRPSSEVLYRALTLKNMMKKNPDMQGADLLPILNPSTN